MTTPKKSTVEEMKELLSDPKNRIKLDDYVTGRLKEFIEATSLDKFPVQGVNAQKEEFLDRMKSYEEVVKDLQEIVILLARWGEGDQLSILRKIFSRVSEVEKGSTGINLWIHFGWYPIQILMYSAGIAALSAENYEALSITLETSVHDISENTHVQLIIAVASHLSNVHDAFKWIPGHEKHYVPNNEHLFEVLTPILEELLYLGKDYEELFDEYEIYSALVYIDASGRNWSPVGRFGWKYKHGTGDNVFKRLEEEAEKQGNQWAPLNAGMFNGSKERFIEVSKLLAERVGRLSWW